jgi:hypothetical protein
MGNATRLTNLEVTGELKTGSVKIGLTASDYKTAKTDGTAAAGSAPTKAEFDAVVELANDLKAKYNALVDKLAGTT